MKFLLILLLFFVELTVHAQVVRIPDPNFKQRLIALGFDTNDDQQIQVSEALKVTKLYVDKLDIVNLEGINSFTNLEELGCYNNKLTVLDVSKLKKLKYLYAFENRIAAINTSSLTELEHLYVQGNLFIAALDVSKNTKLKDLIFSNNRVDKLDVTGLNQLEKIEGDYNRIETGLIRKAPALKSVSLKDNPIYVTVDIRGLTYLEYFDFSGCNLLFINFSGTVNLKRYFW